MPIRVVFMGTPAFAVPSLAALHQSPEIELVGVITAVDKPAGRGQKLSYSAVKEYALAHQLTLLQPPNLKAPEFLAKLQALAPDIQAVVAFRMLPEVVWALPPKGTINLHASLLPDYRGAAPINWAVMSGETETGLTTFFIQQAIDTGQIIDQVKLDVPLTATAGDLHDRMMHIGADLLLKSVVAVGQGKAHPYPQPAESTKLAPKLFAETCRIDWRRPASELYNFMRGLAPYPTAWSKLADSRQLKIFASSLEAGPNAVEEPGKLVEENGKLYAGTGAGWLRLTEVQLEGRKRMTDAELLRGMHLPRSFEMEPSL